MNEPQPGELLASLQHEGFALTPLPNLLGWVDGVHANRFVGAYVDSVVIRGTDCAAGTRVRNVFSIDDPFREPEVVWRTVGTLADVVEEIRSHASDGAAARTGLLPANPTDHGRHHAD